MRNRFKAALLAVALAVTTFGPGAATASANGYVKITGAGSTWSQVALSQWQRNVASNYGMTVNYSGTGSSAGRSEFANGTLDFAVSEIPYQSKPQGKEPADKMPSIKYAYLPIVAGGTSFMYHLKINGQRVTNLRLSGEVITKIFNGQITKWNDPAIAADNPGLALPPKGITPVIRSDGSGTSAQFTLWMSKMYPQLWPHGMRSQFPNLGSHFKAQQGSENVSGYVAQNYGEGAITYVEYSYAKKAGFPIAKVLNQAGYYVEPTALSVAVGLQRARINKDLTQNLDAVYTDRDPRTYPLSSYSYAIVPLQTHQIFDEKKGNTLAAFLRYVVCEGQQQADPLGYSPLPINLVQAASDQIKRIPGSGGKGVDPLKCNNPTLDPSNKGANRLAKIAPMPNPCDKKGAAQCEDGTGGARQKTKVKPKAKQPGNSGGAGNTEAGGGNQPGAKKGGKNSGGKNTGGKSTGGGKKSGSGGGSGPGGGSGGGTGPGGSGDGNGSGGGGGTGDGLAPGVDGGGEGDPGVEGEIPPGAEPIGQDEDGNPIYEGEDGGEQTVAGEDAAATPFELPEEGMGADQWVMVGAAGLLLGAIAVPPLVGRRIRNDVPGGEV